MKIKSCTSVFISIWLLLAMLIPSYAAENSMNSPQKVIKELDARDKDWLEQSERLGLEVLSYYAKTMDVTPENLDVAFRNWKEDKTADRAPEEAVASGLGVLFGNYVVKNKDCHCRTIPKNSLFKIIILTGNFSWEIVPSS